MVLAAGCMHTVNTTRQMAYEGHPIIGVWRIDVDGCTETYDFLPDGTRHVTSGMEIAESVYTISDIPLESGFYKIQDKIIKDNGKPDCLGKASDMTGHSIELFVQFSSTMDEVVFCFEESIDTCFGPFQKMP